MSIRLQPVRLVSRDDDEARLVFAEERLAAVLVRLSKLHGDAAGRWFYEAGFGPLDGPDHPTFADLETAQKYIRTRLETASANGLVSETDEEK